MVDQNKRIYSPGKKDFIIDLIRKFPEALCQSPRGHKLPLVTEASWKKICQIASTEILSDVYTEPAVHTK